MSALPIDTHAVLLGELRICLTASGSPELSEGAGAGTQVCIWFCLGVGVWNP